MTAYSLSMCIIFGGLYANNFEEQKRLNGWIVVGNGVKILGHVVKKKSPLKIKQECFLRSLRS